MQNVIRPRWCTPRCPEESVDEEEAEEHGNEGSGGGEEDAEAAGDGGLVDGHFWWRMVGGGNGRDRVNGSAGEWSWRCLLDSERIGCGGC